MAKKAEQNKPTIFDELIKKEPKLSVLSDNPVSLEDMKADVFNFAYHLGPVYDIIRQEKTQTPLTIGINGKWGTGKTTAMKWLCEALEQWNKLPESKDIMRTRNVWFYPWKYHTKEDVWKGLIAEVILNATDFENASPETVLKAFKLLSAFMGESVLDILSAQEFGVLGWKINGGLAKKIRKNFQQANHPETAYLNEYEKTFKEWIKDSLSGENQRMVIFIDDLDRCMPDIALQVLEALKLYLNIEKLIFVVGMDRDIINKAVEAYYAGRNIKDIGLDKYLCKMLQVELQLSPLKREVETYLDSQLGKIDYAGNLEDKYDEGKPKFYDLFRNLILKHAGRNPREINRLINNTLIRGAGAKEIKKGQLKDNLVFEQGVQIYFIQYILAKEFKMPELVGDGGAGDEFFAKWSEIVRANAHIKDFPQILSLPPDYYEQLSKAATTQIQDDYGQVIHEVQGEIKGLTNTFDIPEQYIGIINEQRFKDLVPTILANKDLGDLMQIEYSHKVAELAKGQDAGLPVADDATIIRNAIARELKKEPDPLTDKDYGAVTELKFLGNKISDISVLSRCKNLEVLSVDYNEISDISPISKLTSIVSLGLSNNQISDISPLSKLTGLTVLSLDINQVNDISALSGLTNLTELWLDSNEIDDISPLSKMTGLVILSLDDTSITDISPLMGLINLRQLNLRGCDGITAEQVAELQKALPDLQIHRQGRRS